MQQRRLAALAEARLYVVIMSFENSFVRQGFDICREPVLEDLCGIYGFMVALRCILRLKRSSLMFTALPCNSWIFLSSGTHRRTGNIFGQPYPFVITGNILATRCAALISVAICRSVTWFLENPKSSKCKDWPYFRTVLSLAELFPSETFWRLAEN